jgi:hypothetical protein
VVETLEVGDVVMVEKLVRLENPIQRVRSVEREETDIFWGLMEVSVADEDGELCREDEVEICELMVSKVAM